MGETRKLAAILVSDVVGYSRLAGADEDRTLSRLRGLRSDLVDPAIAAHHGRVVKRTGDGALVEFRSVVDAVRCAIEVQSGMVDRNAGVPQDRRIEFRIGIHVGDVVEEGDGDLMGDGVNIAARLEGISKPGAICLSEDAYRQVSGRLDIEVTDLGPTQLKNIAQPIRAYLLQVGAPAPVKPMASAMSSATTKPAVGKKPSSLAMFGALAAALLIVIASGVWFFLSANRPATVASNAPAPVASNAPASTAALQLSIVVLPFTNLSGDPAQDYIVDAVTDELTTSLARVPDSFVIARNTAFTYRGKPVDAKAIGKDLGVRYVLEGSMQPSGAQMRVNAQLIDADSGAHLWAEQFDTPRADLLQMQDEIVTHIANAISRELGYAEAARLKRMPVANPSGEVLALQCVAAVAKGGYIGKDADVGYRLCEEALDVDPNNVRGLSQLSVKFYLRVAYGQSADPKADLKRAEDLLSQALALDPNYAFAHMAKSFLLFNQARYDESMVEAETTLALDPANVYAFYNVGINSMRLGQFEKALEYISKAVRLSPRDPGLSEWYNQTAILYFAMKQYDRSIEYARRAMAINPNNGDCALIASLILTGRESEAREALQRYLALPDTGLRTIAEWKAFKAQLTNQHSDVLLEAWDRQIEALRKAGMPEE
jgi:adenylate cyclase